MNIFVFCSGRIRTLVAMATYNFQRLIMGKKWNLTISDVSLKIFDFFYTDMVCRARH